MIQLRFVSGHAIPHYVGSRPGLFSVLVKSCTHPVRSAYLDGVAEKLLNQLEGVPLLTLAQTVKVEDETETQPLASIIRMNRAAAKSVVQMAVKFGFLTENLFWSWKGHVLNIVCQERTIQNGSFLNLELAEKVSFLKFYLEADGAMLLLLAKLILESPNGISTKDFFEGSFYKDALREVYSTYREMTGDLGTRSELRQKLSRLETQRYDPYTRRHKLLPRLIPLEDFGLLTRQMTPKGEIFLPSVQGSNVPLRTLVSELKDIKIMEQRFSRDEYFSIISRTLCGEARGLSVDGHKLLSSEIAQAYTKLRATGVAVYSLEVIIDVVCTRILANLGILTSRHQVLEFLQQLQKAKPYDLRFHVDRQGRPAYVALSDSLLKEMESNEPEVSSCSTE